MKMINPVVSVFDLRLSGYLNRRHCRGVECYYEVKFLLLEDNY